MLDENHTAAKLEGKNCLIKFKDGEELYLALEDMDSAYDEDVQDWFLDADHFINNTTGKLDDTLCIAGFAIARDSIKYIRRI